MRTSAKMIVADLRRNPESWTTIVSIYGDKTRIKAISADGRRFNRTISTDYYFKLLRNE